MFEMNIAEPASGASVVSFIIHALRESGTPPNTVPQMRTA